MPFIDGVRLLPLSDEGEPEKNGEDKGSTLVTVVAASR